MKKLSLFVFVLLFSTTLAYANDPDIEGRITTLDVTKSIITVKNELENKIGLREYRVLVKQGMINDYKKNDKLKIWLMADHKEAKRIERIDR
jgi:hypothetical protein